MDPRREGEGRIASAVEGALLDVLVERSWSTETDRLVVEALDRVEEVLRDGPGRPPAPW